MTNSTLTTKIYEFFEETQKEIEPFSAYTANVLWTDLHISQNMLSNHLEEGNDMASRRHEIIRATISWMDKRFNIAQKNICDLGCGPGLYASLLAELGAMVTGIDFSETSILYAKNEAFRRGLHVDYHVSDYLHDAIPGNQDIVMLIYGDICALSPHQRNTLYGRVLGALIPGGTFVFDVFSPERYSTLRETATYGHKLMNGFWSPDEYFGFHRTRLYPSEKISLDHYLIVERRRKFEVFNWIKHFEPAEISDELSNAGFEVTGIVDVKSGEPWNGGTDEFAILARKP